MNEIENAKRVVETLQTKINHVIIGINKDNQKYLDKDFVLNLLTEIRDETEEFIKYPEIINQIIGLQGIIIELIGNWIWISGNTYPYKSQLKQIGFYFAPKKIMWYYRPPDYKSSNRNPKTIDYIRLKYGSDIIGTKKEKNILGN